MMTTKQIALFLLAAAFVSCSESAEEQPVGNVLCFSASHEWPDESPLSRSSWDNMGFVKGNEIEVFACYKEQADASPFSPNFMNRQIVSYDGFKWTYSPLKYWPMNGQMTFHGWAPTEPSHEENPYLTVCGCDEHGMSVLSYECRTGLDPFYEATDTVGIANGVLSGEAARDGNGRVTLTFHPVPNRYDIVATADKILYDPEHGAPGDYQECRFLIISFKIWGVYKKAEYSMSDDKWYNQTGMYTKEEPLDMTPYLNFVDTEASIPDYKIDSIADYVTPRAVIVGETPADGQPTKLFNKPGFFIPADPADIPDNEAGFEIQYVVLTNKPSETEYKETGIITRSGSLKEAFNEKHNGRVRFVTDINLHFSIEELTVTCTLYDYIYKAMF